MKTLEELPKFPGGALTKFAMETWRLTVGGQVEEPLILSYEELFTFPPAELTADFECAEGWMVLSMHWEGFKLAALAERVRPKPGVNFITFHAGDFIVSLPYNRDSLEKALLAYRLNGQPIPPEHGAPLRLFMPGGQCYESVKWVERVEFSATAEKDTGRDIALGRIVKE